MKFNSNYERLFYQALRIRLVEEKIAEIYPSDNIQSPIHLSIGQEHISVALCASLKKDDLVFGTYRGHALYLAKGGSLKQMLSELYGKVTGCGKGKAGSMHLSDASVGMMGSSAVVATTIPHAVGSALASKILDKDQISVCFFGEGATSQGAYHESLNFAAKYELPVLFVCENNDLAIYTKVSDFHKFDVTEHAKVYTISSRKIREGCDLNLLFEAGKEHSEFVRKKQKPFLLEINTYRYRQHVGPDEDYDLKYRNIEELREWQQNDPLIENRKLISQFEDIILEEIEEAIGFAEESAFPDPKNLLADVL